MNPGELFQKKKLTNSGIIARGITILLLFLVAYGIGYSVLHPEKSDAVSMSGGWVDENGNPFDLGSFYSTKGGVHAFHEVESISSKTVLFLRARNMFVDVYVDNVPVYFDDRDIFPLFGSSPGTRWHVVNLPVKASACDIEVIGTACYSNSDGRIDEVYFGDTYDVFRVVCLDGAFSYIMTLFWLSIGLVMLLIYILFQNYFRLERDFWYLSAATFFCALWCSVETHMWQFFFGYSQVIHFVGYLSLLCIPVLLGLMAERCLEGKWKKSAQVYTYIAEAVFLITTVLHLSGIVEYHYTVYLIHGLLLASTPFAVAMIRVYSSGNRVGRHKYRIRAFFALLVAFLCIGIFRYLTGHFEDYAIFIRWALLLFLLIMLNYQLANINSVLRKGFQSEFQHEMALTDYLTKFYNRAGFAEHSKEYEKILASGGPFGVIQFDVNNLKKVNDNQGHEKGDELICLASSGIFQSFGMVGKCYRMGGDEFLVVLTGEDAKEVYEKGIADLDVYCGYANSMEDRTFDVKIAYGFYMAQPGDTLTEVQDRADVLMYQKKREMKAADKK